MKKKIGMLFLAGAVVVLALAGCEKAEKSTGTPNPTASVTTENQADGTATQKPTDSADLTDVTPTPTDGTTPTDAPTDTPTEAPTPTDSATPTEEPTDGTGTTTDGTEAPIPTDSATPTDGTPTPTDSANSTDGTPTQTPTDGTPTAPPTDGTGTSTSTSTDAPTSVPTDTPTEAPTPTSTPTQAPTSVPTNTPTPAPTNTPAPTPTQAPTPSGNTSGGTKVSGWVNCIGDASDIRIPTLDKFNSEGLSSKYRGNHNPGYWNAISGGEFEDAWGDARDALDRKYSGVQGADGTWYIIGGSTDTDYGAYGTAFLGYGAPRGPATAQWVGDVNVSPKKDGSAYELTYTLDLEELSDPTLWRNETILLLATIVPNPKEVEDAIFEHEFGDQSKSPIPIKTSDAINTWVRIGDVEVKLQYVSHNPVVVEFLIRSAK